MINQVLELGGDVGLLPSFIVQDQAETTQALLYQLASSIIFTHGTQQTHDRKIISYSSNFCISVNNCMHYLSFVLCSS